MCDCRPYLMFNSRGELVDSYASRETALRDAVRQIDVAWVQNAHTGKPEFVRNDPEPGLHVVGKSATDAIQFR